MTIRTLRAKHVLKALLLIQKACEVPLNATNVKLENSAPEISMSVMTAKTRIVRILHMIGQRLEVQNVHVSLGLACTMNMRRFVSGVLSIFTNASSQMMCAPSVRRTQWESRTDRHAYVTQAMKQLIQTQIQRI
jgi:hypothetical protein